MDDFEQKHPRGHASHPGRFSSKENSAPEIRFPSVDSAAEALRGLRLLDDVLAEAFVRSSVFSDRFVARRARAGLTKELLAWAESNPDQADRTTATYKPDARQFRSTDMHPAAQQSRAQMSFIALLDGELEDDAAPDEEEQALLTQLAARMDVPLQHLHALYVLRELPMEWWPGRYTPGRQLKLTPASAEAFAEQWSRP